MAVNQAPAAVTAAVKKAAPRIEWKIAFRFEPKGEPAWYRLAGHDAEKRVIMTMRVEADGTLGYFQTELPRESLPKVVAAALKEKMPGFTPQRVDGVSKDAEHFIGYRFEGTIAGGKAEVVLVTPDGKRVMTELDAARLRPGK